MLSLGRLLPRALVAVLLLAAAAALVVPSAGPASAWAASSAATGADYEEVDTDQPPATVRVLPKRCVGEESMPMTARPCQVVSGRRERPVVIVWGDSHAWQQIPGLAERARTHGNTLMAFVLGACPPTDLRRTSHGGQCAELGRVTLDYVQRLRDRGQQVRLVIAAHWHLYRDYAARAAAGEEPATDRDRYLMRQGELYRAGTARAFRTLKQWNARTFAVAQQPTVPDDAPECEAGVDPYACDLPRAAALPGEAGIARWLSGRLADPRRLIDLTPGLCDAETCRSVVEGRSVYLDDLHLDPTFTPTLAGAFDRLF